MKYRFEQFKTDIDNPTVAVSSVTDNMNSTVRKRRVIFTTQ